MKTKKTITDSTVDPDILAYTVGDDPVLDLALAKWDCMGTAAHVTMLSEMKGLKRPVVTKQEAAKVRKALGRIVALAEKGKFTIREDDQDVHMAVERLLTEELGDLGKKIHTGRSRNDQVAVDVRLHMKDEILAAEGELGALAAELCYFGWCAGAIPLVGRTHLQPAMPSTVEMWATGHAEMVLDQLANLEAAYKLADANPLGSAAGYGVPLPLDRARTTKLLGFSRTIHNCFGASMARGECEAALLSALAQLMAVLSRLAEDMILFSMPEFAYFRLPREYCTGSSIMPQKFNPDVLELVRSKAAQVLGLQTASLSLLHAMPGGYNRDLQDCKWLYMKGLDITRTTLSAPRSRRAYLRPMSRFARWRRARRGATPTTMSATTSSSSTPRTQMPPSPSRGTRARASGSTTISTVRASPPPANRQTPAVANLTQTAGGS